MPPAVALHGFTDLNRALARADKKVRADVRDIQKSIGEPVASAAQSKAVAEIRNLGVPWSMMRVGVTSKVIYVAPSRRGRRSKRPNLGTLLMERAMLPALHEHAGEFEGRVERALDEMAHVFYRKP